ncbi:MAG: glycoside hydrolase family 32 protein [Candidatus Latescibacteria bacterium]|nr:glycoside hydrolase family 32 protein [Candidatus Latescibacterota bacterium]
MTVSEASKKIGKTEKLIRCAQELREQFQQDPHRPVYHFLPPWAWMNDINGALFWQGRYHIFYQHNPDGAYWKWIRWGHASSTDLVHWTHHPIALTPTPDGPDREGCFSGGAVVQGGVPTLIYHGVPEGTCIATCQEMDLIHWTTFDGNPVIPVPKPGEPDYGRYRVYDPCAWQQGDSWYALCGSHDPSGGDTAYLFRSSELIHWEYLHPFYTSDRRWTETDEDCAVPNFFPLGDRHMLLFCSHLQGTQYYLGRYEGDRFYPEDHARMSWPGGHLGGGITMLDGQGRRLFFDWVREASDTETQRIAGWSGVMTLPRVISLDTDGRLRMTPVPELEVLRLRHRRREQIRLLADSERTLDEMRGTCLELLLEIEPEDARELGVKVRCSPDGAEETVIVYTPEAKTLKIEVGKSSLDKRVHYYYYRNHGALERLPHEKRMVQAQEAPFELRGGESLKLRIFLDRSVLEVFANERQCVTQRIYPARSDSLGVALFSRGGSVNVRSVDAWDVASAVE